jgi:DNA-binding CsgD family transcriptional regulator
VLTRAASESVAVELPELKSRPIGWQGGSPDGKRQLGTLARLALLGVVVSLVVTGVVAAWIEAKMTDLMLGQVAQRAYDQLQLGVLTSTRPTDFEPPFSASKREDLAARLDPLLARARQADSGIIRLNLFARDGTILYSDLAGLRGQMVSPLANELLGAALTGKSGTEISGLSGSENADLQSRYGQALEAYIPLVQDGQVVGVFEFYEDLSPIAPIRPLVWSGVTAGLAVLLVSLLLGMSRLVRGSPTDCSGIENVVPSRAVPTLAAPAGSLTRREVEVLRLMAAGLTYSQIAARLVVDDETVRSHAKGILRKLGQSSRADAVVAARRAGILEAH